MFRHVSHQEQTPGNILSEKHRETSNVSEFARKHFCFSRSKFCFRNNVSTGGQTGKHLRKLVCPGLYKFKDIQGLEFSYISNSSTFKFCTTLFCLKVHAIFSLICSVYNNALGRGLLPCTL